MKGFFKKLRVLLNQLKCDHKYYKSSHLICVNIYKDTEELVNITFKCKKCGKEISLDYEEQEIIEDKVL